MSPPWQVPMPDGATGDPSEDSSNSTERPDTEQPDRPIEEPEPENQIPPKPGGPELDYNFGDSQGWNPTVPANPYRLTLTDSPASNDNLGLSLREPADTDKDSWLDYATRTYRQADQLGLVGATLSTIALFTLAPVAVPSVLGAIGISTIAGAAAYGWTNVAVRLAGGGGALEPAAGLFDPFGFAIFSGKSLIGGPSEAALRDAGLVSQIHSLRLPDAPGSRLDLLRALAEAQQWLKNAGDLGVYTGSTEPPISAPPQGGVPSKPGGPVRVLRP